MSECLEKDLISIVIPVYNVENYLEECVHSVLNQTYCNLQIILVDDGSTDRSGSLCDMLAKEDSRIEVYHKKNGGLSDARNCGIAVAKGQYIGFVDADDFIAPDMYECLYRAIRDENVNYSLCNLCQVDKKGNILEGITKPVQMKNEIIHGYEILDKIQQIHETWSYIPVCTKLYTIDMFHDVHFPVGKINEDEFVFNKLLNPDYNGKEIPNEGYFYRRVENTITSSKFALKNLALVEAYYERALFCKSIGKKENLISLEEAMYRLLRKSYQEFIDELNQDYFVQIENMYKKVLKDTLKECNIDIKYKMKKMFYLYFTRAYVSIGFHKKIAR